MLKHKATINFMYWVHNQLHVTQEWCIEVWGSRLGNHFYSKWNGTPRQFRSSTDKMLMWFIFELSDDNKETLLTWVEKNYINGI